MKCQPTRRNGRFLNGGIHAIYLIIFTMLLIVPLLIASPANAETLAQWLVPDTAAAPPDDDLAVGTPTTTGADVSSALASSFLPGLSSIDNSGSGYNDNAYWELEGHKTSGQYVRFTIDTTNWRNIQMSYYYINVDIGGSPTLQLSYDAGGGLVPAGGAIAIDGATTWTLGSYDFTGLTNESGNTVFQLQVSGANTDGKVIGYDLITFSGMNVNTNTDGDALPDYLDACIYDPLKWADPGICGCGTVDNPTDTDSDGTPDCADDCPSDPLKTDPGFCGCGVSETDTDVDGTPDCIDVCPNDPAKTAPGTCGCGVADTDTDGDGIPDCIDGDNSTELLFPYFTNLGSHSYWNLIVITNMSSTAGTATLTAYENDGDVGTYTSPSIPAYSQLMGLLENIPWTGTGLGDSSCSIHVAADFDARGFAMMSNGTHDSMGYIVDVSTDPVTELLFPYFTSLANHAYWNGIVITNMGATAGTATLTAYEQDGSVGTYTTPSIPAYSHYINLLRSIPWAGSGLGDSPCSIQVATDFDTRGFAMMAKDADSMGYIVDTAAAGPVTELLFPYFTKLANDTYWNGIVITNMSSTAGTATLTAYERDGSVGTYTTPSIPAYSQYIALLENIPWSGIGLGDSNGCWVQAITDFDARGFAMMSNGVHDSMGYIVK